MPERLHGVCRQSHPEQAVVQPRFASCAPCSWTYDTRRGKTTFEEWEKGKKNGSHGEAKDLQRFLDAVACQESTDDEREYSSSNSSTLDDIKLESIR